MRIADAARELLAEGGFAGLSVDGVAARAGVARTTIYRRYPSRIALALAALQHPPKLGPPPDTGSLEGDLAAIAEQVATALTSPGAAAAVAAVIATGAAAPRGQPGDRPSPRRLAEEEEDPIRDALAAEGAWMSAVLDRARERGELSRRTTPQEAIDLLAGPLVYRLLVRAESPDPEATRRLAARVAAALTTEEDPR